MLRDMARVFARDRWLVAGSTLAVLIAALALLGPPLAPHSPYDISFSPLSRPAPGHPLGVNDGGGDIFSELLHAIRSSVGFGLLAGTASLAFGVFAGLTAACGGRFIDAALMRFADMLLAIPGIMILILTAAFFMPSPWMLALLLAAMSWPTTAKAIRAQARVIAGSLHIRAARQMGGTPAYIILRHLLPELFPLYLAGFVGRTRMAILTEATLSFLGLLDASHKSLGGIIRYALKYYYLDIWWNWLLPPILSLTLLIMAFTFLSVGFEKVFDPKLREAPR
jgi:peptide/nickel transport system permease protein